MSIRTRLTLLASVVTAALVAAGGLAFRASLAGSIRATLRRSLVRRAERAQSLFAAGRLPLQTGRVVRASPDQSVVQVLTGDGRVAYTSQAAGTAPLAGPATLHAAARGPTWLERMRPAWHNPYLLLAEPERGRGHFVLLVGTSLDQLRDSLAQLQRVFLVAGPLAVLAVAIGSWVLVKLVLAPVDQLGAQAEALAVTGQERLLAVPPARDELAALTVRLNGLLERLHSSVEDQRRFVAAASHELRTPLTALAAELELAQRPGRGEPELRDAVVRAAAQVDRLVRLAQDLLLIAQGEGHALDLVRVRQPLETIVASALQAREAQFGLRGVSLVLDADPTVEVDVDDLRLRQALDNLLDNALRFSPEGSCVNVSVAEERAGAVITVRDHGPGFSPELLQTAFNRFVRGGSGSARGRADGGTGLGLSIVRMLVEAHGGSVAVAAAPGGGALVIIQLPIAGSVGADRRRSPALPPAARLAPASVQPPDRGDP